VQDFWKHEGHATGSWRNSNAKWVVMLIIAANELRGLFVVWHVWESL
jgi:hypothetical protein